MKQEEVLQNVSTSVFLHCIPYKLMTVTTSYINHKFVKWPNQSERVDTNVAFHKKRDPLGVIGGIDGIQSL